LEGRVIELIDILGHLPPETPARPINAPGILVQCPEGQAEAAPAREIAAQVHYFSSSLVSEELVEVAALIEGREQRQKRVLNGTAEDQ